MQAPNNPLGIVGVAFVEISTAGSSEYPFHSPRQMISPAVRPISVAGWQRSLYKDQQFVILRMLIASNAGREILERQIRRPKIANSRVGLWVLEMNIGKGRNAGADLVGARDCRDLNPCRRIPGRRTVDEESDIAKCTLNTLHKDRTAKILRGFSRQCLTR